MGGLDMPPGIADSITALVGDGRGGDALFDSADTIREDVEIALGEVRPQLNGILSTDTVLSSVKRRDMLTKYDANPAISASELIDGFDLSQSTVDWVNGLLGEARARNLLG